jgi:hypothetical protein
VCAHAFDGQVGVNAPYCIPLSGACIGKESRIGNYGIVGAESCCCHQRKPGLMFRKIGDEEGVTLLYDEIDTVFGPRAREHEELRGLLNAGHRRGAVAGVLFVARRSRQRKFLPMPLLQWRD